MKPPEDVQEAIDAIGRQLQIAAQTVDPRRAVTHDSPVSDAPTRAEMEARLGEVKAGTETQFERLRGDIRELKASSASTATVILTAIALFAAIVGVIAAMTATGWSGFGTGLSANDLANKAADRAVAQALAHKGS